MRVLELAEKVLDLFRELDEAIEIFKSNTGIRCRPGCFQCCTSHKVEATVLEFLPLALCVSESEPSIWPLDGLKDIPPWPCIFLRRDLQEGGCSIYKNRGLVCRLFGMSFTILKTGKPELLGCKYVKELYRKFSEEKGQPSGLPISSHYALRLIGIDLELGSRYYPINTAIQKAFEMVGFYLPYKKAS